MKVKILVTGFGSAGTKQKFKTDWKTQRLTGTIVEVVSRGKFRVKWDYDGDMSDHNHQQLRIFNAQITQTPQSAGTATTQDSDNNQDNDDDSSDVSQD